MSVAQLLAEMTAMLAHASPAALREVAGRLRAAVPPDEIDLAALAEGIVCVLDIYGDDTDRELLVTQIHGDLASIAYLLAQAQPSAPTPPRAPDSPRPAVPAPAPPKPAAAPAGLPAWVDPSMLAEFYDGQLHGLTEVEEMMLDAANLGEAGKNKLARILHTLKGESATVGFASLEELYHSLEDRLLGAASPVEVVDDALALKDWVLRAVPALISGEPAPDGREELLARLRAGPAPEPEPVPLPLPAVTKNVLPSDPEAIAMFGEFFDEASESLIQADELLVSIEAGGVEPASVDALFRTFHTLKGLAGFLELGSIQALAHAVEALLDDARNDPSTLVASRLDLILRATNMVRSALHATREAVATGSGDVTVAGFDALLEKVVEARRRTSRPPSPARVAAPSAPAPAAADEGGREEDDERRPNLAVVRETIKVDLTRVDSLVETIGELVIVEAMVNNAADLRNQIGHRTRHQLAQLSKIVRDLQRQGLALRMVPLRGVFQKMSRLVRDLSRRSGKSIQLELSGQDAEMDRSLAERLGDPLVHMMRNAADHGIEPADQRVAAGKPPTATIRLAAYHEGGNIIIELSDDGRGLNRDAIVKKAVERGLIDPATQLTDPEAWELIFAPGFSTAAAVTEISGRGVGMDVVKRTVEELRGRIQISSAIGKGTTFRLVLPLTLAIIDGMLMVVGGRRYVLPTLSILESMKPLPNQLHQFAGGGRILDVRGDQLPLVDLGGLLGVPSSASHDPTSGFVVVVDGLRGRFGLLVDDLIGQQQVVIKHIDTTLNSEGLFSGGAILSDGQVGLILNPTALRVDEPRVRRGSLEAS